MAEKLPSYKTLNRYAKALGLEVWHEYRDRRTELKRSGLTPREAIERAAREMDLVARWRDWSERRQVGELLESDVPLTPEEVKKVIPSYVPHTDTRAEEVGEESLTFAEEVLWARDQRALVQNGSASPTRFPSVGALSWYQYSLKNPEKFMQHVASVSKPTGDGDNLYEQDGQYQFKEISRQLEQAVLECGEKLVELEHDFAELFSGQTS